MLNDNADKMNELGVKIAATQNAVSGAENAI